MHKLSDEERDLLLSPDYDQVVTVGVQKKLQGKIGSRFQYCMETLFKKFKVNHVWYDFDNEGGEDHPGEFEIERYRESIDYTGEFKSCKTPGWENYSNSIPTSWLWMDFEEELDKEIEQAKIDSEKTKEKEARKNQGNKIRKMQLIRSIKNKLNAEELKIIQFK